MLQMHVGGGMEGGSARLPLGPGPGSRIPLAIDHTSVGRLGTRGHRQHGDEEDRDN